MRHQKIGIDQAVSKAAVDPSRILRLSQTLAIALICAVAMFAGFAASGVSLFASVIAAIATLNAVPLLLGLMLSAIR